jgi:uncharacterized protein YndB with AHSA1/START domain
MKKLKIGLSVLAALALASVAVRRWLLPAPAKTIERSLIVAAPPSVMFDLLKEAHLWPEWMPRDRLDPDMRRNFGGPPAGLGAYYLWSSRDGRVGEGQMTITEVSPTHFEVEREMTKPAAATIDLEFTLTPDGPGTRLSVSVSGSCDLSGRPLLRLTGGEERLTAELDEMLTRLRDRAEPEAKILASRIERTVRISAAPDVVLAKLTDVHRWAQWSPWAGADAKVGRTFGGTQRAVGSSCFWTGEGKSGRVTIVSMRPDKVEAEVELEKPRPLSSDLEFSLAADGKGTRVIARATGALAPSDLENAIALVTGGGDPMQAER